MTLPVITKNNLLGGQPFTHASLHTAFTGSTGANEVMGGTYAQQAVTVNVPSGGVRSLNASVSFAGLPVATIKWIGFWNAGAFVAGVPNGGATPKNFMAVYRTDTVYSTDHGWSDGQKIAFFQGTPSGGLTEGTTYFVRDSLVDSFKVAATAGGVAIDLTSASSYGCVVAAITEDVYAAPLGTHTLSTASVVVPD